MRGKQIILIASAILAQMTFEQREQLNLLGDVVEFKEPPPLDEIPPTPVEHYAHIERRRQFTHPKSPRESWNKRRRGRKS